MKHHWLIGFGLAAILLVHGKGSSVMAADRLARSIVVTVDDLPIAAGKLHSTPAERRQITAALLAILAEHSIRAVGFVTWRNVHSDEDRKLLEMWLDAGHELGNHTVEHLNYSRTSSAAYIADAEEGRARLAELLEPRALKPRLFRFPYLREGETIGKLEAMRAYLGTSVQRNFPPSIDTQDWSFEGPWVAARKERDEAELARIADRYQRSLRLSVEAQEGLGDRLFESTTPQVLLLHANEVGAAQWGQLFAWLSTSGHRFVAADAVLADSAYGTEHAYVGDFGPGLWHRIRSARDAEEARGEIAALLAKHTEMWNRGEIRKFCEVYTEDAVFLSPSGIRRGRDEVLKRYLERYPDPAAMGKLELTLLDVKLAAGTEVTMLGDAVPSRVHGASVAATWRLSYPEKAALEGQTLIIFRKQGGEWRIVHDASM